MAIAEKFQTDPRCPHCGKPFESWSYEAKKHVKFCSYGKHPRGKRIEVILSCGFCGERHADFEALSQHVRYECQGKENKSMIKLQRQQSGTRGQGQRGVQFLSPRHITEKGGHLARVLKVTTDQPDNFGNPYVVYFQIEGDTTKYSKGFKPTSALLADLVDMLGEDEKKWPGKKLVIGKIEDEEGAERLSFSNVPSSK